MTDDDLDRIEARLAVQLPAEYRRFATNDPAELDADIRAHDVDGDVFQDTVWPLAHSLAVALLIGICFAAGERTVARRQTSAREDRSAPPTIVKFSQTTPPIRRPTVADSHVAYVARHSHAELIESLTKEVCYLPGVTHGCAHTVDPQDDFRTLFANRQLLRLWSELEQLSPRSARGRTFEILHRVKAIRQTSFKKPPVILIRHEVDEPPTTPTSDDLPLPKRRKFTARETRLGYSSALLLLARFGDARSVAEEFRINRDFVREYVASARIERSPNVDSEKYSPEFLRTLFIKTTELQPSFMASALAFAVENDPAINHRLRRRIRHKLRDGLTFSRLRIRSWDVPIETPYVDSSQITMNWYYFIDRVSYSDRVGQLQRQSQIDAIIDLILQ